MTATESASQSASRAADATAYWCLATATSTT